LTRNLGDASEGRIEIRHKLVCYVGAQPKGFAVEVNPKTSQHAVVLWRGVCGTDAQDQTVIVWRELVGVPVAQFRPMVQRPNEARFDLGGASIDIESWSSHREQCCQRICST
jgi:hypothetical protein